MQQLALELTSQPSRFWDNCIAPPRTRVPSELPVFRVSLTPTSAVPPFLRKINMLDICTSPHAQSFVVSKQKTAITSLHQKSWRGRYSTQNLVHWNSIKLLCPFPRPFLGTKLTTQIKTRGKDLRYRRGSRFPGRGPRLIRLRLPVAVICHLSGVLEHFDSH